MEGCVVNGDERDRLIRLETQFEHLEEKLEDTHKKVTQMHDLLMQAKGARWVIICAAGLSGAVTAFAVKFFPFFGPLPK